MFATLLFIVLLAPMLSERVGVPPVVGLVLAGVLVGEHGLGLLMRGGIVEALGSIGLLYLMFVAGLELDLDEFTSHRRPSLVFGLATFAVPFAVGTWSAMLLDLGTLPSVLIGSAWASHTLLAYPVFRRAGTFRNRAVAVTVGATIITDTLALLVLAVVAGATRGALGAAFWLELALGLTALLVTAFVLLPRLARWFFAGLGQDRSVRFLFVLAAAFTMSGLAEIAGIEGIVGAFFAGLALNRLVPDRSLVMERIEFVGSNLFIPLFLVSVGMLIDPAVAADVRVLGIAAVFIAVALGAKAVAAELVGRLHRYGRAEIGAMFALSSAQAAATLAAVVVGVDLGLLDVQIVNAVVLVILVTCLAASAAAGRWAARLPNPVARRSLGASVVVPVARPSSAAPLVRIAAAFAQRDGGVVIPLTVVTPEADRDAIAAGREVVAAAEMAASAAGAEAAGLVRIDASPTAGVLHTVVEHDASLMVLGWQGHSGPRAAWFGGVVDTIVSRVAVPTLVVRVPDEGVVPDRLVLALLDVDDDPINASSLELSLAVLARLGGGADPVEVRSTGTVESVPHRVLDALGERMTFCHRRRGELLTGLEGRDVLTVVPARADVAALRGAVGHIDRQLRRGSFVMTVDATPPPAVDPTRVDTDEPVRPGVG